MRDTGRQVNEYEQEKWMRSVVKVLSYMFGGKWVFFVDYFYQC